METPLANFKALLFPLSRRIFTEVIFSIPGVIIPTKEVVKPNIKGRSSAIFNENLPVWVVYMTNELICNYNL